MPSSVPVQPRGRKTRSAVHVWDKVAELVITVGGFSVIVAVLGILVYLVSQVLPIFKGGHAEPLASGKVNSAERVAAVTSDEYRRSMMTLTSTGALCVTHLTDGATVWESSLVPPGRTLTAWSFNSLSGKVALGFDDGTIQLGSLRFESSVTTQPPANTPTLVVGASVVVPSVDAANGGTVVERLAMDQYRSIMPVVELRAAAPMQHGTGAVRLVDYRERGDNEFVVAMRQDHTAELDLVETVRPLGGGAPRSKFTSYAIPFVPIEGRAAPDFLFVTGDEAHVLALWRDGKCQRYASAHPDERAITLAETVQLLEPGHSVSTVGMLLGGLTLLIGDDRGELLGAFVAVDRSSTTTDSCTLVVAHRLQIGTDAVTSVGVSTRDRTLVVGDAGGHVSVRHMTSEKEVVTPMRAFDAGVVAAAPTPKLDGIVALDEHGSYRVWSMEPGHPEASVKSLFGRVQYEGSPQPEFVYQSSSGEDTSEVKLSIIPLILGTLKATFFAMLFAVPTAVMAALYTSEFMNKDVRKVVKPAIEMMASLPSVVLGFIAAIVVAPYVRDRLPAILLGCAVVPLGMLTAAYLWQLIPPWTALKVRPTMKLMLMAAVAAAGVAASALLGPPMEKLLFKPTASDRLVIAGAYEVVPPSTRPPWVGGRATMSPNEERQLRAHGMYFRDGTVVRPVVPATPRELKAAILRAEELDTEPTSIRRWLDGGVGGPWPGWLMVLLPPMSLVLWAINTRLVDRRFQALVARLSGTHPMLRAGPLELAKFALTLVAVVGASALGAWALSAAGFDARDSIFGPFSQRNTLVVGIIMGFAVIPIIYTISEDALASVPNSLRSASLGAGATVWQTAWRVVLPVAASGVFSAVMIGLGRAAGETMIVVMATGNTPSTDWNLFSGFRTLSANIAVELPEAPNGSTHYRVLFLCGFVLFALTFIVNTIAEWTRQYFRKRSIAL